MKKNLEDEINDFLNIWDCKSMVDFLRDIIPLFKLYDIDKENDCLAKKVDGDEEDVRNIRLIRTVYLISKIAETHAAKLCSLKINFNKIHKKMEKVREDIKDEF